MKQSGLFDLSHQMVAYAGLIVILYIVVVCILVFGGNSKRLDCQRGIVTADDTCLAKCLHHGGRGTEADFYRVVAALHKLSLEPGAVNSFAIDVLGDTTCDAAPVSVYDLVVGICILDKA